MKKYFLVTTLCSALSLLSSHANACILTFYVDSFNSLMPKDLKQPSIPEKFVQLTVISTDNKYQYTTDVLKAGNFWRILNIQCGQKYNIYAQVLDGKTRVEPFGNYSYIANPIEVNGNLPIFFPSRFTYNNNPNAQ